jgi:hypothetical protein
VSDDDNGEGGHLVSNIYRSRILYRILKFRKIIYLILSLNSSSTAKGISLLPTANHIFVSSVRRVEGAVTLGPALLPGSETGTFILILQYYYALSF